MATQQVTADHISQQLAERHAADLFVAECRNGPQGNRLRRLDAWVLLRTWSPITMIGYEIKVSRQDWLRDDKSHEYLALCHLLYYVSPPRVIEPQEVPAGCGLLWTPKTGQRFTTKVKPVRRDIELPARLMVYVLMSRTRIVADMHEANAGDRTAQWRAWLAEREDRHQLGHLVRGRLAREYRRMQQEVREAQQLVQQYAHIEQRIRELGCDPMLPRGEWPVVRTLDDLTRSRTADVLRATIDQCQRTLSILEPTSAERAA